MPNYIVQFEEKNEATARLICFPYAGATVACYHPWASAMPPNVELCVVEIPGRHYLRDQVAESMDALVDTFFPQLETFLDKPYAFFGHSYGAAIAYAVARRLQKEGKKLPKGLFVSSRWAPHVPDRYPPISHLPDDEFIKEVQKMYQAIPERILKEKELLTLLLPMLKQDIRMNERYLVGLDVLLDIPITLYYGIDDNALKVNELERWGELTNKDFEIKVMSGGHFFIDDKKDSIVAEISKFLQE